MHFDHNGNKLVELFAGVFAAACHSGALDFEAVSGTTATEATRR